MTRAWYISFMSCAALTEFFENEIADCRENDLMCSLHLKATMMKISDPIMFGHCVKAYYKAALEKHAAVLEEVGFNANNGIGDACDCGDAVVWPSEACDQGNDVGGDGAMVLG